MPEQPLVSCLCVTRNRVPLLRRAVGCFLAQTYQPCELVVVYESDDPDTRDYVGGLDSASIRGVEVPSRPRLTLGTLRNLSLRAARGFYVAQWDDDDWHSPTRLADQMRVISLVGRPGCILIRWTLFDWETRSAFVSGERPWEGSLVAERSFVPAYLDRSRGEDSAVIDTLLAQERLAFLDDPHLYVYVYHGSNVWDRKHWEDIMSASRPLSREGSKRVARLLAACESEHKDAAAITSRS